MPEAYHQSTPAGPADTLPTMMTKKIQRAKRAEERGREEFGELSDWGGVSFALSLFTGYNPPPPPPPQLFHHPHSAHVYGRHATFPPESPKRTIPCPPRSEVFSCFCLSRNLSFPVAISWTTYSDTFADQTLRSCRNFHNFFPELLRRTTFEGGRSREEFCLQCLDWLCAGRMKMNTLGQCDCSRQLFTFCLVSST